MTRLVAQIDGIEIAYRVDGDPGRPWIVLSNSLGMDLSMWDNLVPQLCRKYQVLRYDARGHGGSGFDGREITLDRLVMDLISLLDFLEIAETDVLGLSLGGMTALGLGLDHPQRVGRIICAAARAESPPQVVKGWEERIVAVRDGGIAAICEQTLGRWFTHATHEKRPDVVRRTREILLRTDKAAYCACAAAIQRLNYSPRLVALAAPTMFVAGAADVAAPPEEMRAMAASAPRGQFESVPDAAHLINLDQPQAFNSAVSRFLGIVGG